MDTIVGIEKALTIDGWMSEDELIFLGRAAATVDSVLQVGCYKGRSSYVIGKNVRGKLLDIDSFVGDFGNTLGPEELAACYKKNVEDLLDTKIELIIGDSHKILPVLNRTFDMIFIDGSHTYVDAKKGIELAIPLLNPGGLLCGHDYSHSPEVKRAVDDVLLCNAKVHEGTSIWYLRDDRTIKAYLIGNKMKARTSGNKLHLGCGKRILPGYINIDLYRPEADLQLDITDLRPFADNSVDEIYLNAVFEHLYTFQHRKALSEWRRVLRPGGLLRIDSTPDFDEVIKAYIRKAKGNTRAIFDIEEVMRYTHGAYCADDKDGQMHKDIFTKRKMKDLLDDTGFAVDRIESVRWGDEPHPVNINVTAVKKTDWVSPSRGKSTFGAVYCVYDDDTWLKESVASVYGVCDAIYFLVGEKPWHGERSDNSATLECIKGLPDPGNKICLLRGKWTTETDQRNAGLYILKEAGIDYCFVVDADEIYDPEQLRQMMLFAAQYETVSCWHMTWDTYWKSYKYVITPREPFTPVVFVKIGAARFAKYRSVSGENHGFIPPEIGFCHHMSYARSDEQILKKITTFSHAREVRNAWYENIWKRWDSDHTLIDLHPTHPSSYHRATRQPLSALPPILRERLEKDGAFQAKKPGVVSIIILTFNQLKYTRECVESIRKRTPEPHEIFFVDNGSTDGTVKWLKKLLKENPNYKLIENHKNLGFPRGCNQGINASSGEYILLLNNDVVVTEGWLSGMLECLNSAPDIGIVGPMTNNISGTQKVEDTGYQSMADLNVFAQSFRERNRHRRIPMRRIVGFCMLFRRELVEKIGLLDETFGTGNFEDDDFCLRAALEGYKNFIAGDIFIHHYGSMSFRGNRIDYSSAMTGNRKIFKEKWSGIERKSSPGEKAFVLNTLDEANTLNQKGKVDVAVGALLEGIRLAPTEKRLYYAFSEILIDAKQFKDAYEILKEMSFDESDLRRLELIGYCAEGMEFYDEAEGYAGRALSLNPASAPALNLKGILAHKKGDNEKAQELFQKAIKADPGFGEPYTNSGVLKWAAGQREEALDLLERGCILSPTVSDIVTSYHSAISTLGQFERAEKVFRETLAFYPLNRRIAFLLIDTLIQQGKNDIAMREIEKAMLTFGIDEGMLSAALNIRETLGPRKIEGQQCSRITLSLCMIVKNEEAYIAQCLTSVAPVVDEMIIVDTGSTDRTKDIAKAFGAQVYDFQWTHNFAEARNFSLAQAHGDWIIVLDADEVISSRDHAALTELIKKKKPVGYSFTTRNYTGNVNIVGWVPNDGNYRTEEAGDGWFPSQKVRLFPRDPRIRFENPVHEFVEHSLQKEKIEIERCRIPVHHYGKLDHERESVKKDAYYELGKTKLQEKGDDLQAISELAIVAGSAKKYEEAIELWQRTIAIKPDYVTAFLNLGHVYLQIQRYEDALAASKRAVELAPDKKEAVVNYASAEVHAGDVKKAISVLEHLLNKIPEHPPAIGVLAAAYCIEGEKEKGLAYIEKIKKLGFNCPEFLYKHARSLISAKRTHYATRLLEAAVESNHVNNDITLLLSELQAGNGCERLA